MNFTRLTPSSPGRNRHLGYVPIRNLLAITGEMFESPAGDCTLSGQQKILGSSVPDMGPERVAALEQLEALDEKLD